MTTRNLLIAGLVLILTACSGSAQNRIEVNSTQVQNMLRNDSKLVVLDVRTPGEFVQGHIKGAVNIDVNQTDAQERINKLDKNATYIVYCRTKNRSGVVVNHMAQNGFRKVYQMMDGITGWNMNGLPLEK